MEETQPLSARTAVSRTPNSSSVKTITSAIPSPAQSNISQFDPKNNNDTNLIGDESNTTVSLPRTPISANVRFLVALAVLITQEWIRIHSFALTRQKRAFFDETNILETYQPRSRTHGHLFQPDPPTPGPVVKFDDDPNTPEHSKNEKAAFNAMRDAHYENMFEYAARVAKEAEEADRQALEAQKSRLSQNDAALPQGEPLYEDLPTNPPVNGPPSLNNGTKLELPPSLMEKSEDSSRDGKGKSPKQKSSKITKGLLFEDHVKGSNISTAATSTSTDTTASTQTTNTTSLSTATSGGSSVKSGQKRNKNKKL